MIRFYTHPKADLDALASLAVVEAMMPGVEIEVVFDANPPEHNGKDIWVADIGNGPFDHHQLPDVRSTCAAALVNRFFLDHGQAEQQQRAAALAVRFIPLVFRQDTTGSVSEASDELANLLGLPEIIKRLQLWLDDQETWSIVGPILRDVIVSEERRYIQSGMPLPKELQFQRIGKQIAVLRGVATVSGSTDFFDLVYERYPSINLIVSVITWNDSNGTQVTVSRSIGKRRGFALDIRDLMNWLAVQPITSIYLEELRRWHVEPWFAGRGGLKRPVTDVPPNHLADIVGAAINNYLREHSATDNSDPTRYIQEQIEAIAANNPAQAGALFSLLNSAIAKSDKHMIEQVRITTQTLYQQRRRS